LSASSAERSIDSMILRSHRSLATAVRALVAGAALLAVIGVWAACGRTAFSPLTLAGHTAGLGPTVPAPPVPSIAAAGRAGGTTTGLETSCTVAQLTRLVDQRRFGAARRLLAGRRVWPRRELIAISHIRFISARVWGDPRADGVTLAATVRLAVRPGSPLSSGLTTLFFTLGRDGTAGDWLVTAVTTSP
jgi:hypothetical protein